MCAVSRLSTTTAGWNVTTPYLLLRYNAHINIEYYTSVKAVKSLYKYIFKRHDRIVALLTADKSSLAIDDNVTDEVRNYVNCRYIGAMKGTWRIFHFPLHRRHPAVQPLDVHLEHQHRVIFQDGEAEAVVARGEPRTTLNFATCTPLTTTLGFYFIINCQNILHGIRIQNDGANIRAARAALFLSCTQFTLTKVKCNTAACARCDEFHRLTDSQRPPSP